MNQYKWATEDIYKNIDEWQKQFNEIEKEIDFSAFRGKLDNEKEFLACMQKQEKVGRVIEKLGVYAMMKHDEDTANSTYDALNGKVMTLSVKFSSESAFVVPELTALPKEKLNEYIKNPALKEYDYFLLTLLKEKEHVLSESEEKLLAESGEAFACFKDIFTKIDNADLPLGNIRHKGEIIPLSHGMYGALMHSDDRAVRKKCFKEYYKSYISLINTISATYAGSVKKDVFVAKARKYSSALDKALCGEDVDYSVYQNLIKSVNDNLYLLHDYLKEKKRQLKLKEYHMFDVYASTVKDAEIKLPYDKAYDLVIEGLKPLGEEYSALLKKAKDERWIDVYESKGKRSGAYSVAVYDTHPYVLLNYQQTTHDVFTIAHEMGHSIHSYFSNKTQPYMKADYKIFVAEVASTVNEVLLVKHLLKTAKDNETKKFLLSYLMEMIRTTIFRQTQFAEFEEFSHSSIEKGEPLTKENMCEKYLELNKKYYGKAVISDDEIKYEWARIPHFYRAFYVYKYATGLISALAIADRILTEGEKAVKDYFAFLSSGGSDSPVELLKIAGVDLTDINSFEKGFKVFSDALNEFKKL